MGKTRVIAETGAGQHGVATATAAALFGLECTVYMGKVDTERQALNVARMRLLGAEVIAVESGTQTLKDAMNEAMRDWVASVDHTHYLIGTVAGPHPFPLLVREFQRIISTEARAQVLDRYGRLPDAVAACVGGGSNALGIFADFIPDAEVAPARLRGRRRRGRRPAGTPPRISAGSVGVLHGMRTFVLQDSDGQTKDSHSISAGLDYPGVGPEHSWLASTGRATYEPVTDAEAMEAFALLTQTEGILPAIESAHGLAGALRLGRALQPPADGEPSIILVNLSGRGDKDVDTAIQWFNVDTRGTGSESGRPVGTNLSADPRARPVAGRERTGQHHRGPAVSAPSAAEVTFDRGRTGDVFAATRAQGRGALVGFLHVGYPDVPDLARRAARADRRGGERGGRPRRGRPAVQRPDDGRRHDPAAGLTFSHPVPLDMRIDPRLRENAADLVNSLPETDLANVLYELAQERYSRRIARKIVEARRISPIKTTERLAELVRSAIPARAGGREKIDPATRTFLALRMKVNRELENLARPAGAGATASGAGRTTGGHQLPVDGRPDGEAGVSVGGADRASSRSSRRSPSPPPTTKSPPTPDPARRS